MSPQIMAIGLFAAAQLLFAITGILWVENDFKFNRMSKGLLLPVWLFVNALAVMCLVGEAAPN